MVNLRTPDTQFASILFVQVVNNPDYKSSRNDIFYLTDSLLMTDDNYIIKHLEQQLDLFTYYYQERDSVVFKEGNCCAVVTHIVIRDTLFNVDDFTTMADFFRLNASLSFEKRRIVQYFFNQITKNIN